MSVREPNSPTITIRKVGVVGVIVAANNVLVIERSQFVRSPGRHCFPGGTMERGETEEQTLVRELREELGLNVTPVRRLHRSLTPGGVDLRWWLANHDPSQPITLNPTEVAAASWVSVEQLSAIPTLLVSNREFLAAWQNKAFVIDGLANT